MMSHILSTQTKAWQQADREHHIHPFTDASALARKGTRVITRGEGIYLWDSEGQRILDGMSGLWNVNLGYGQPTLIKAAHEQLQTLPFYNSFFQCTTPPSIELAQALAAIAPAGMQHVFYSSSGSEGNDTVVRLVRRFWQLRGEPSRRIIISRKNAYHGSTIAGASLGGMTGMHEQLGGAVPDIEHIDQPHALEHAQPGESPEAFGLRAARWLEERIQALGPERVAAFIGEPVQGAGGVIVPPSTYWPEIERICKRHGILLVSDEVICGFGRTGQWWGCQTMGFQPDLITFAKGVTSGYIPLGGVLVGPKVAEALTQRGGEFTHGYTNHGHPVACAVALATLQRTQALDLVHRVREELAPHLAKHWAELQKHPLVGSAQCCGLLGALELMQNPTQGQSFPAEYGVGLRCREHCFAQGLVMRAVGDRMVIAPPLVITIEQIDEMAALIRTCLDLTLADAQREGWLH